MNNGTDKITSLCGRMTENGLPEGAIAIPLFGSAREAVQAGVELGIDFAARLLEVTADEKTNKELAGQTPAEVFTLAATLIRCQAKELTGNLNQGES